MVLGPGQEQHQFSVQNFKGKGHQTPKTKQMMLMRRAGLLLMAVWTTAYHVSTWRQVLLALNE